MPSDSRQYPFLTGSLWRVSLWGFPSLFATDDFGVAGALVAASLATSVIVAPSSARPWIVCGDPVA